MKVTSIVTALALGLATAGLAQAAETTVAHPALSTAQESIAFSHEAYYPQLNAQTVETRAQVEQQLKDAQAKGLVTASHDPYFPVQNVHSTQSRAEVVQALRSVPDSMLASAGHEPYYPSASTL